MLTAVRRTQILHLARRSLFQTQSCSNSSSPAKTSESARENSNTDSEAEEMARAVTAAGKKAELSTIEDYRIDMEPFAKNLFAGKFDKQILTYPDILNNDR